MSEVELVHPVAVDEAEGMVRAFTMALLMDVAPDEFPLVVERRQREWPADRTWGARADGRWVGTLASDPKRLTVPGPNGGTAQIDADGLTMVGVNPTHRRRGLLTRMLTGSLQEAKDRGDVAAALIAAEWAIYGRFGYAPAVWSADYTYFPRLRGAAIEAPAGSAVRQVEPAELGTIAPTVFDAARLTRAGQVTRPDDWWSDRLGLRPGRPRPGPRENWLLHEEPSGPDGFVCWAARRGSARDSDLAVIEVLEFVAPTNGAYRGLWAYLSGIDLVGEITWRKAAVDEPLRWLPADGRALRQIHTGDHTWLRLLDVPGALSARGYAVPGRVVIEVVDPTGLAGGRFALDAEPGGATCTPTTGSADLVLDQRALAAAYLGGRSLHALRPGGGVEEVRAGALALFDAMLATPLAPWNATIF